MYLNNDLVKVNNNYYKEKKSYLGHFHSNYLTKPCFCKYLYQVEYLYIVNKLNSDNFIIYEIEDIPKENKIVYCRCLDNNRLYKVKIPVLDRFYDKEDIFISKRVYSWKKDKRIRKVMTSYCLFNRHEKRYYKVGDINKYHETLIKIEFVDVYDRSYTYCSHVGLKI